MFESVTEGRLPKGIIRCAGGFRYHTLSDESSWAAMTLRTKMLLARDVSRDEGYAMARAIFSFYPFDQDYLVVWLGTDRFRAN